MIGKIKEKINETKKIYQKNRGRVSYSQCGEDLIISTFLKSLEIKNFKYLDIGTHHPFELNNTYLFYLEGYSGVCVEPDPELFNLIKKIRSRDICLNLGVGLDSDKFSDFYIFSSRTLNTFSSEIANQYLQSGKQRIEKIIKIQNMTINDIIKQNFHSYPNYISLDIEGLEYPILESFNFEIFRPEIFCIETLTYSDTNEEEKTTKIIDFMLNKGYMVLADTYINTIFIDRIIWKERNC